MKLPLSKIFLGGICVSLLAFSNDILDSTLLPRLLFFSVTSILFFILLPGTWKTEWRMPTIIYALFCLFNIIGILYAVNKEEAVFESSRVLLGFFAF